MITSLKEAIDLSLLEKEIGEVDVNFNIEVESETWNCYTAHISTREILLYCDKGTASFVVDTYGDRALAELFDWEKA